MSAWTVYLLACAALLLALAWLLRNRASPVVLAVLVVVLLVFLGVPSAVPGTNALAPAWLAFVYEELLGDPELAQRAIVPLRWALGSILFAGLAIALLFYLRGRQPSRRQQG